MDRDHETFVVRPGLLRVVLLSVLLVVGAAVFLFLAAVAAVINVSGVLARGALLLLALFLAALAVYFLLVLSTIAQRIEVGPERLKLRLPRTRGPLPLLGVIRAQLPYGAIASVERREEVYVSFGLVTVQHAFSLVTRDGARLPLGVMAGNWGYQLPFDQAAQKIAERAGCSVIDRGAVRSVRPRPSRDGTRCAAMDDQIDAAFGTQALGQASSANHAIPHGFARCHFHIARLF